MALPVLPQDVFDEIISQLTDKTSTLKSCSLVCRSFRRSAQKMLFNYTFVMLAYDDNVNPSAYIGPGLRPTNLVLIVRHAPHLIEYIQELDIHCYGEVYPPNFNASDAADLANALGTFSRKGEFPINLQSFSFEIDSLRRWDDITSWAQHALMLLMSVDSLRHIFLDGILDCPADIFQNIPLLKHLSLITTTFSSLPTTQKERPKLESLTIYFLTEGRGRLDQFSNNVGRVVNTTQLKTFEGRDCTPSTMPVIERILRPTSNSLEHLTLQDSKITDLDPVSINLNWFSRLTDITIYQCYFVERIPPMLVLITKAMKSISHLNVIQNLSFRLEVDSSFNIVDFASIMKDVWQEVDMIWSIPQLVSSESFRGVTFDFQSRAAHNWAALSDLIQNKLPKTNNAGKLHIKTPPFR